MKERVIDHPTLGKVLLVRKRGIRRITIKVSHSEGIRVTLPWLVPTSAGMLFLHQTEDKILKILHKQSLNAGNRIPVPLPCDPIALRAMKKQARASLTARTQELALVHGFTKGDGEPLYGRIALKDNRSNWGSCSAKGNINLNIRLHLLPEHLRDYVILHELCHLRHMNHGPEFHKLLESLCPLHLELKKELGKFSIQQ